MSPFLDHCHHRVVFVRRGRAGGGWLVLSPQVDMPHSANDDDPFSTIEPYSSPVPPSLPPPEFPSSFYRTRLGLLNCSTTHQGNDRDLFAVASTIMHLPQSNAVSDGITLLPPGLSWMSRALLCAGAGLGDLPEGHGLKREQARNCFTPGVPLRRKENPWIRYCSETYH